MVRNSHKAVPQLRRVRIRLGLTQDEMATRLGVNRSTVVWLESTNSLRTPGIALAEKIAGVIGRTTGQVVDEYKRLRAAS